MITKSSHHCMVHKNVLIYQKINLTSSMSDNTHTSTRSYRSTTDFFVTRKLKLKLKYRIWRRGLLKNASIRISMNDNNYKHLLHSDLEKKKSPISFMYMKDWWKIPEYVPKISIPKYIQLFLSFKRMKRFLNEFKVMIKWISFYDKILL